MTEQEVRHRFKEVLGEEATIFCGFQIGNTFSIQIIKKRINLQFRFNSNNIDKALEMTKEMFDLYEKYGINWLALSFAAEEIL